MNCNSLIVSVSETIKNDIKNNFINYLVILKINWIKFIK